MMAKSNRKPEPIPLCPLAGFSPCHRQHCAPWDDDWKLCSLNYGSVYSSVRAAACDAAVEVVKEYVGDRKGATSSEPPAAAHLPLKGKARGTTSSAPQSGAPSPEGEGSWEADGA